MPFSPYQNKRAAPGRGLGQPNIRPLGGRQPLAVPQLGQPSLHPTRSWGQPGRSRHPIKALGQWAGGAGGSPVTSAPTAPAPRVGGQEGSAGSPAMRPSAKGFAMGPPDTDWQSLFPALARSLPGRAASPRGPSGRPEEEGYKWFYTSQGQWVKRSWPPPVRSEESNWQSADQGMRPNPRMLEWYQSQNPGPYSVEGQGFGMPPWLARSLQERGR